MEGSRLRATLGLALILTLALLAPASARPSADVIFATPAQLGGNLTLDGSEAILLTFQGTPLTIHLHFDGSVTGTLYETQYLTYNVEGVTSSNGQPIEAQPQTTDYGDHLDVTLNSAGPGSLFIAGRGISLQAQHTYTSISPLAVGHCMGANLPETTLRDRLVRPGATACANQNAVFTAANADGQTALALNLSIESLQAAEWHGMTASCPGECPEGGTQTAQPFGNPTDGATLYDFHYVRVTASNGGGAISGEAQAAFALANQATLNADGWLRLPQASSAILCPDHCDKDQTLRTVGNFTIDRVSYKDETHLSGAISGSGLILADETIIGKWLTPAVPIVAGVVAVVAAALALIGLFSRTHEHNVLENPTRRNIFEAVQANPGLSRQALAKRIGRHHNTVTFHLAVLQRTKLVSGREFGRARTYFAASATPAQSIALLQEPALRRLFDWVAQNPGRSQVEVIRQLELAWSWRRSSIRHRLARLVRGGALVREITGATSVYMAKALGPTPSR